MIKRVVTVLVPLLPWCGMVGTVRAQESSPPRNRWELILEQNFVYDDNVFRLSEDNLRRMDQDRASDRISGRYDRMDSEDDFVLETEVELRHERPGWFRGEDFRVAPGLRYETYLRNERKNHPEAYLDLVQKLGGGRSLALDLEYRLDVFARNYLARVTDPTGSVSSSERRYEEGVYDQWSADLEYDHRIWKRSSEGPAPWYQFGLNRLDGTVSLGVGQRFYESPFSNRDRDVLRTGIDLNGRLGRRWTVTAGAGFERVETDNGRETLVRDEPDFGVDLNGDLDATDQNVGTLQPVDRTRNEWSAEMEIECEVIEGWTVGVRATQGWQDYSSNELFDVTHRGRTDRVRHVRIQVEWEFRRNWEITAVAGFVDEESNRAEATEADDEDVDYRRSYAGLSLQIRL